MLLGAMSIQLPRPRIGSDNSKETSRLIDETGLRGTTVLLTTDRDASVDVAYRGEHQKIGEAEGAPRIPTPARPGRPRSHLQGAVRRCRQQELRDQLLSADDDLVVDARYRLTSAGRDSVLGLMERRWSTIPGMRRCIYCT